MTCCSPFTAAMAASAADPARHVNFVAGMVLGVDDYGQEFAYHSARDKWIVRDFLGYGTLSGLAVAAEADGTNGPRVRVTAGSAAAPSGQLICVGRDQCGSLNAWLNRTDVAEEVRKRTEAPPLTETVLNLYLTLCYVDCAVAEVPIPGEPCRSDENLMAPSRIADDYCLEFRFDPPAASEARAIDALSALFGSIDSSGPPADTPAILASAVRQAEIQLRIALGVAPPAAPTEDDLKPIKLNPAALGRFGSAVKRLWITRLRPFLAAQKCGAPAVAANDCLLLARVSVPIVKVGVAWVVKDPPAGKETAVEIDEADRAFLLSAAVAQSGMARAIAADPGTHRIAFMDKAGPVPPPASLVIVRSASAVTAKLPKSATVGPGKVFTVKAAEEGIVTLSTTPSDKIDGADTYDLPKRGAATIASDGTAWHVIGLVQ